MNIINEASTMSEEEKVRLWELGERVCNISAASEDKLKRYFKIAKIAGYKRVIRDCLADARRRGIVLIKAPWRLLPITDKTVAEKVDGGANKLAVSVLASALIKAKEPYLEAMAADLANLDKKAENAFSVDDGDIAIRSAMLFWLSACCVILGFPEFIDKIADIARPYGLTRDEISDAIRTLARNPKYVEVLGQVQSELRPAAPATESLDEAVEKHEDLNPKLWNGKELKPEVKEKINLIIEEFLTGLKEDNININIKDAILVGSNCSYNYNNDSDLDIHLITSLDGLTNPDGIYEKLYSAYRSLFNKKIDVEFYGIPVELYIETEGTPGIYNGMYSIMQDKWLEEPKIEEIPELDKEAFDKEFKIWEDRYNKLTSKHDAELKESLLTEDFDVAKSIVADQIRGEWDAIKGYKKAVDDLSQIGDFNDVIDILNSISDEEEVHVGELEKVQSLLDDNVIENIQDGRNEAENDLAENEVPVDESLSLKESSLTFKEVTLPNNYCLVCRWDKYNGFEVLGGFKADDGLVHDDFHKSYATKEAALKDYDRLVAKFSKGLEESILKEANEFGQYKAAFIKAINKLQPDTVTKSEDEIMLYSPIDRQPKFYKLWNSILHHTDGKHDHNEKDFSNYVLIQSTDGGQETANLIHKLVHLLSYAEGGKNAQAIINKINSYNAQFITIQDNKVKIYTNVAEWWKATGNKLADAVPDKVDDMQPGQKLVITEEINNEQLNEIDQYIEEIYELRKTSLANEGQYGIGNLVFKEIRNKGYLDNLKELKNKLISQELSLESLDLKEAGKSWNTYYYKGYKITEEPQYGRKTYHIWKHNKDRKIDIQVDNVDSDKYSFVRIGSLSEAKHYIDELINLQYKGYQIKKETIFGINPTYYVNNKGFDTPEEAKKYIDSISEGSASGLSEHLTERQRIEYRNELGKISFNQAVIQDNGLFHIYNIKENEVDRIIRKIRDLDYIDWVKKSESGKYDFSKVVMFGQPQAKYYNITGQIKQSALLETMS